MVKIETDRLFIRSFKVDDYKDLYDYLSDEQVVEYEPYDIFNIEECKREAAKRAENSSFLAVCLKETGKLIGNLYYNQQEPSDFLTWEIGFVFNRSYQKKGYAAEACNRLIAYSFTNMKVRRIIAMCNVDNINSWRLLERLHMRREGHYLKRAFFKQNSRGEPNWFDVYEYAILRDEWKL